jgi:hypothetical protein
MGKDTPVSGPNPTRPIHPLASARSCRVVAPTCGTHTPVTNRSRTQVSWTADHWGPSRQSHLLPQIKLVLFDTKEPAETSCQNRSDHQGPLRAGCGPRLADLPPRLCVGSSGLVQPPRGWRGNLNKPGGIRPCGGEKSQQTPSLPRWLRALPRYLSRPCPGPFPMDTRRTEPRHHKRRERSLGEIRHWDRGGWRWRIAWPS